MRISDEFDSDHLTDHVEHAVQITRRLAQGKPARVPLLVPLGNIEIEPEVGAISLGQGHLVPPNDLVGRVPGVAPGDEAVLVLDTELRLLDVVSIQFNDGDEASDFGRRVHHREREIAAARARIDQQVTSARLAMALASDDGFVIAPTVAYRQTANPLRGRSGSARGWSQGSASGMPAVRVGVHTSTELQRWAPVAAALPPSMAMGARRIVSAVGERMDPLDAFVDAVIAWENLIGSEGEISFRLCAAISKLAEPEDDQARHETFAELRRLYGTRSALVHGSREPSYAEATKMRDRAVHVALATLRAIAKRDDLWQSDSAGQRNRVVLLGA